MPICHASLLTLTFLGHLYVTNKAFKSYFINVKQNILDIFNELNFFVRKLLITKVLNIYSFIQVKIKKEKDVEN